MPIELTRDDWTAFAPGCPERYSAALFDNLRLLIDAGILDNEHRWCHFAATVYHETGNFREIRENLSYKTPSVLRRTWPSRFGRKSDSELAPLLGNPKALAESVYGGRMGNQRGTSDAYDYRGGGWFNTTGRAAVAAYCAKIGVPLSPNTLDDPVLTLRFAVFEWTETKCNKWADENDARKIAKAINTGSASSNIVPVGMPEREAAFRRAWRIWGDAVHVERHVDDPVPVARASVNVPAVPTKAEVAVKSTSVWASVLAFGSLVLTASQSLADWLGNLIVTLFDLLPEAVGAGTTATSALSSLGSMIGHDIKAIIAVVGGGAIITFMWRHIDLKHGVKKEAVQKAAGENGEPAP